MSKRTLAEWEALLENVTEGEFAVPEESIELFEDENTDSLEIIAGDDAPSVVEVATASYQGDKTVANAHLLAASKESVEEVVRLHKSMEYVASAIEETIPLLATEIRNRLEGKY